jgi:hypothetical protein
MSKVIDKLNRADEALTNLEYESESEVFTSAVEAARAAINAARAVAREQEEG